VDAEALQLFVMGKYRKKPEKFIT